MFALANTCLSRHGPPVELTGDCLGRIGDMSHLDRITSDQAICHGRPIVRGLRYPVESLLELLAAGMSTEEILADYPDLERDDLRAALEFAAIALGTRRVTPLDAA